MEYGIPFKPRGIVNGPIKAKGDITFSRGCVVQPNATIIAESGPIEFGENCIVSQHSTIIFKVPEHLKNEETPTTLYIGSNNVFGVGCTVKALKIGDRNVFNNNCYVSEDVEVSSGCVIGAGCRLEGRKCRLGLNQVIDNSCIW